MLAKRVLSSEDGAYSTLFREGIIDQPEDLLDCEQQDLVSTIDNPEKHTTTMESFITFRITTKVACMLNMMLMIIKPMIAD